MKMKYNEVYLESLQSFILRHVSSPFLVHGIPEAHNILSNKKKKVHFCSQLRGEKIQILPQNCIKKSLVSREGERF